MDTEEINKFFAACVDLKNKKYDPVKTLSEEKKLLKDSVGSKKKITVHMEVLEDFKEENDPRQDVEGILKKGDYQFIMEEGMVKTFGKDMACDYIIPCEEVDSVQFQL